MGYIKDQIKDMFRDSGGYAKAKSIATNWFRDSLAARDALEAKPTRKRFEPGKIYVFKYENPITEEKLKWWDKAPVVLALDTKDHTDIGINLNLLPAKFRQAMLDAIYERMESKIKNATKGTRASDARKQPALLDLKYDNAKRFLDRYGFGFAIRRYLPNLKKNQAVVSYESWGKIAICEFAKIHGSTISEIRKEFQEYNANFKNEERRKRAEEMIAKAKPKAKPVKMKDNKKKS